jgi:hypothetical protein
VKSLSVLPVAGFCLFLAGVAPAADSLNVRLIGYFDTPGAAWDVAVIGEIAYVAETGALRVISVADPAHPVEVGHCDLTGRARGVAVVGNLAYVADCDSHVRVISVADPTHPVEVGYCGTPDYAIAIVVMGDYAYVADAGSGLRVISIADSSHPVEVGYCDMPHWAYNIVVNGDYAYVADCDGGMRIVSVTDPAHPAEVGSYAQGRAVAVTVRNDTAYTASSASSFRVMSVVDPAHPIEIGRFDSLFHAPQDLGLTDGCVYVAAWGGLQVISVADPSRPVEVGYYNDGLHGLSLNSVTLTYHQETRRALSPDYSYCAGDYGLFIFEFYGVGVQEAIDDARVTRNFGPTILSGASGVGRLTSSVIFDAMGRRVVSPKPGVYFVREAQAQAQAIRKVVITR